jgi:hypothetical protein
MKNMLAHHIAQTQPLEGGDVLSKDIITKNIEKQKECSIVYELDNECQLPLAINDTTENGVTYSNERSFSPATRAS